MSRAPFGMMWLRTDVSGSEFDMVRVGPGLHVRGSQHAIDPIPYRLTFELSIDNDGTSTRLLAKAEGAGWTRSIRLTGAQGAWDATGRATGAPDLAVYDGQTLRPPAPPGLIDAASLRGAVDIDLGGSPLTNSLPIRRLGLLEKERGHRATVTAAWVLPPTLEVVASVQTYTVAGDGLIEFDDAGTSTAISYDTDGWVLNYPGLARRVA